MRSVRSKALSKENTTAFLLSGGSFGSGLVEGSPLCDLSDGLYKDLRDVQASLGRGLKEGDVEAFGEGSAFLGGDLAELLHVGLVAHEDEGDGLCVLDAQDVIVQFLDLPEGGLSAYRVDTEESFAGPHVLITDGAKVFLSCCIKYVEHMLIFVHSELLSVTVFERRVILFDKLFVDELDSEARLSDTTFSDHDDAKRGHGMYE